VRTALKVGGVIASVVFWVMEERSTGYAMKFANRIGKLEELLGYQGWRGRKMGTEAAFAATNVTRLLYFAVFVFWLGALWRGSHF